MGCYNSTPLKMNLVLEIRTTSTRRWEYSVFGFFFTSSCSSIVLIMIPLHFANLLTLLQVTYQTDSKILTNTPNYTQVTPITRPPFLFSPYYQFSFLKYSPSNGAFSRSWSKVGSITSFKTLMTLYAQIKLLNSQTQF